MTIDEYGEVKTPFLRTAYNYDTDQASLDHALYCEDESRTQQQFADEVDINTIVERFGLTGEIPQHPGIPLQSEFLEIFDYQSALNKLIAADEAFMEYPASIRAQFQNDPHQFIDYVSDPNPDDAKKAKLREWHLLAPETPRQAPIEVKVIPDPSEPIKTP